MQKYYRVYTGAADILWAALLIILPITSMPAVRDLLHVSVVASPSVVALAALFIIWFLPYLLKGGGIPREALPLFGFTLAALVSITTAEFLEVPTFKDAGMIRPAVSAFITLLVGIAYFLVTYSRISTFRDFSSTLKWIYVGGILMLIWSLMQSSVWIINGRYPNWMRDFQDLISLGPLYRQRAAGFALEPSWLAHMLNMLYLPMWMSASFSGYSITHFRIFKKISLEMVLLALGILVLLLTLSRVGWITFFCMAAYLAVRWNIRLIHWIQDRFHVETKRKALSAFVISGGLVLIYLALIITAAYGMSRVDPRMADLFTPAFWQLKNMNSYANALQFGERVVYWQAGWDVFTRYPIVGVGLGNAGKWFLQTIPSYGMNLIEVRQLLFRSADLPNIKNLWIRILAETGFIGFSFYIAWLITFLKKAVSFSNSKKPVCRNVMYWGIFIVIGILLEGFSIDSFAMPYFWVSAGLVLSVANITGSTTAETNSAALEEK